MVSPQWQTPEAISKRIGMLSEFYSFRLYNNALRITAKKLSLPGRWWFKTMQDDHVCDLCKDHENKVFSLNAFLPALPRHFGCRCAYELVPNDILPEVIDVYLPA